MTLPASAMPKKPEGPPQSDGTPVDDYLHIRCKCADSLHFLDFDADIDSDGVQVTFVSSKNGHFWNRASQILPYLFGRDDLIHGDVLLTKDAAKQVASFLAGVSA